jgi:hypothetical protein
MLFVGYGHVVSRVPSQRGAPPLLNLATRANKGQTKVSMRAIYYFYGY